jgi:hypothetical protein
MIIIEDEALSYSISLDEIVVGLISPLAFFRAEHDSFSYKSIVDV